MQTAPTKPVVVIYADGACKGNPGRGGWGATLTYKDTTKEIYGGEPKTTNNRMELTAVIQALSALKKPCDVTIYLDSQYVRKGITEWLPGWKQRNWRTSANTPVKNADLWRTLDRLAFESNHIIDWKWVRGHSGNTGNDRADELANKGAWAHDLV